MPFLTLLHLELCFDSFVLCLFFFFLEVYFPQLAVSFDKVLVTFSELQHFDVVNSGQIVKCHFEQTQVGVLLRHQHENHLFETLFDLGVGNSLGLEVRELDHKFAEQLLFNRYFWQF